MNKNTFYVVTVKNNEGLRYSYAFRVRNNENLWHYIESLSKHAVVEWLSVCDNKRSAVDIASDWNSSWANKGIFWISAPILYTVIF